MIRILRYRNICPLLHILFAGQGKCGCSDLCPVSVRVNGCGCDLNASCAAPPLLITGHYRIISRLEFEAVINRSSAGRPPAAAVEVARYMRTHILRRASAGRSRCACISPADAVVITVSLVGNHVEQLVCSFCESVKNLRRIVRSCCAVRKVYKRSRAVEYCHRKLSVEFCKLSRYSNIAQSIIAERCRCLIKTPHYRCVFISRSADRHIYSVRQRFHQASHGFGRLREFRVNSDRAFAFQLVKGPVAVIFDHDRIVGTEFNRKPYVS